MPDAAPAYRPHVARKELPEENCKTQWNPKSSGFHPELFRGLQETAQTSDMYSSILHDQPLDQDTSR